MLGVGAYGVGDVDGRGKGGVGASGGGRHGIATPRHPDTFSAFGPCNPDATGMPQGFETCLNLLEIKLQMQLALPWPCRGNAMDAPTSRRGTAMPHHGKAMALPWQRQASPWQGHCKAMALPWPRQGNAKALLQIPIHLLLCLLK